MGDDKVKSDHVSYLHLGVLFQVSGRLGCRV